MSKFYNGKPCKRCGNTRRFKSSRACIDCHYRKKNKKDYTPAWRKRNPDKWHEQSRRSRSKRRAILRNVESSSYNFKHICNQYGNKCLCCGRADVKLTVDHVIPLSRGGADSVKNIQPLCHVCNAKKHTRKTDYRPGITRWIQRKLF